MIGNTVPLSLEEQRTRNHLLRRKKRGVQLAFAILVVACCGPLWFLQTQEKAGTETLWQVTFVMLAIIGIGAFCYTRFMRKITLDLQSDEKLLVPAVVVRGWQVNARRDTVLTLDIGGRWVELSVDMMKRHMADAADMNRVMPGTSMIVEMTPVGHVITKVELG